ncbi:MAG TPA: NAD-dependent epimerase/dehydratase family protein [Anaerolineales bacterium]|nr:NAD-dependent epimerase/dehydratase family protein [Anaerolineales bacterium]
MILVTGATGFVGRSLIRHLFETGREVRVLLRPSRRSPQLPTGVPLEAAVASLSDERALRAALKDVDAIFHLASAESQGRNANLLAVDVRGTDNLARMAVDAGVGRMVYLSHIGASRSSAYPVFKAKGIAEEHIRRSGMPHTIFRSSIVFGPEDHFTTSLAYLLHAAPGIFPLPGGGRSMLQPLWVEDLVNVMLWSLDNGETVNHTYEIGGSENFSLRQIVEIIMGLQHIRRWLVDLSPTTMRALTVTLESFWLNFPVSSFWLDYVAVNRTCPVDNLPRQFGLMPARFSYRLDYLKRVPWYESAWRRIRQSSSETAEKILESVRTFRL